MSQISNAMQKTVVLTSVSNDMDKMSQDNLKGNGKGNITTLPDAISHYEGYAHDAKCTHSIEDGKASGLTAKEFLECRGKLEELLNSPNPEVAEYARKEIVKLNNLLLDSENTKNLEETAARSREEVENAKLSYKESQPNWLQKLFGKGNTHAETIKLKRQELNYVIKENNLYNENVVDYDTILKHNGLNNK